MIDATGEINRTLGSLVAQVEGLRRDVSHMGDKSDRKFEAVHRRLDEVVDNVSDLREDGASRGEKIDAIEKKIEEDLEPVAAKIRIWEQRGVGALATAFFAGSSFMGAAVWFWDAIIAKLRS